MIVCIILLFSAFCTIAMLYKLYLQPVNRLLFSDYLKLSASGVIAFVADTFGIGSFAVNVALAKLLRTFDDEELPAMCNGAQVLPGALESLFFLHLVEVDKTTLTVLVMGACVGGLIGGTIVSHLSKQSIRLAMMICFFCLIGLMLANECHWLHVSGEATSLQAWPLLLGGFGMVICGALTSVGIGLFLMVQSLLFLLHVSPVAAFPIMMTAGALQQPLTTLIFLKHNKIPLKKTMILSVSGCVGVLITLPLFSLLTIKGLHVLLLMILLYNLVSMAKAYWRAHFSLKQAVIATS